MLKPREYEQLILEIKKEEIFKREELIKTVIQSLKGEISLLELLIDNLEKEARSVDEKLEPYYQKEVGNAKRRKS